MKVSSDGESGDIFIYGDIVTYTWDDYPEDHNATSFKEELDALGDVEIINLYINSPGGSVFQGIAIYNMLKRHRATVNVYIDALAASIASVIAMAGDKIHMPKNSMMMIHNAWTFAMGNADELRKEADDLDRINQSSVQSYLQKSGDKLSEEKLKELLDAETWLSADEALSYGLCDVVEEANEMVASVSDDLFNKYKNVPKQLAEQNQQNEGTTVTEEEMEIRKKVAEQAQSNANYVSDILGGIYK